jgi:serine/threonine-protein kinase PknG
VWTEVPGELAPRLAVAMAAEQAGEHERAAALYSTVVAVDPTHVSAAFGLARCRAESGDREGMIDAYGRVPVSSATYRDAQLAKARSLLRGVAGDPPGTAELAAAAATVDRLRLDAAERHGLAGEILERALAGVTSGDLVGEGRVELFGCPLESLRLRGALEATYRELARLADSDQRRHELVDRANAVRPRTLW